MLRQSALTAVVMSVLCLPTFAQTPGAGVGGGGGTPAPPPRVDSARVQARTSVAELQGRVAPKPDKTDGGTDSEGGWVNSNGWLYTKSVTGLPNDISLNSSWGSRTMLTDVPIAEAEVYESMTTPNVMFYTEQTSELKDTGTIGVFSGTATSTTTCNYTFVAPYVLNQELWISDTNPTAAVKPDLSFRIRFNGIVVREGTVEFVWQNNIQKIKVHVSDLPNQPFFLTGGSITLPPLQTDFDTDVQFESICMVSRSNSNPPPGGIAHRSISFANTVRTTIVP